MTLTLHWIEYHPPGVPRSHGAFYTAQRHIQSPAHGGNLALLMGISLRQSDAAHRVNSVLSLSDVKRIQVLKVSYFDDMRACQKLRLSLWISLHIWCHADVGVMA